MVDLCPGLLGPSNTSNYSSALSSAVGPLQLPLFLQRWLLPYIPHWPAGSHSLPSYFFRCLISASCCLYIVFLVRMLRRSDLGRWWVTAFGSVLFPYYLVALLSNRVFASAHDASTDSCRLGSTRVRGWLIRHHLLHVDYGRRIPVVKLLLCIIPHG